MTIDCDNDFFTIKGGLWSGYTLYDLYKEAATPYEWQPQIKDECARVGIDFLSTPFDAAGADFLEGLGVEAYKVASFELVDVPLIRHIAQKGKPMIVSTGMGTIEEIQDAFDTILAEGLAKEQIVLLKCTSEYPAHYEDMHLATITDMLSRFGTYIGFSDHSLGTSAPVAAVAFGARLVEKHFCLSRNIAGPDSAFSAEPQEFAEMVRQVHEVYKAVGRPVYGPTTQERENLAFRRSIFAVKDIACGEVFTSDNIRVIRPGQGLPPKFYAGLLGQQSHRAYTKGSPIQTQ
jgi:pseudaminic acid synthase